MRVGSTDGLGRSGRAELGRVGSHILQNSLAGWRVGGSASRRLSEFIGRWVGESGGLVGVRTNWSASQRVGW